jgi:phage tail sheath gpL-like
MSELNKVIGSYEPDNLLAANQELPAVADTLEIAASQNLKRGSLVNVSGEQIAATTDGVKASGTITFADQPTADDTVTVGTTTLTFKSADPGENEVLIGTDLAATLDNLIAALPDSVTGSKSSGVVTITAATAGTAGNSIALAKSGDDITVSGATLSGGVDEVVDTDVYAVLAEDCDTTEGAKEAAVYLTGEFNIDAVKVNENVDDMAAVKIAARKVGIFLKKNI